MDPLSPGGSHGLSLLIVHLVGAVTITVAGAFGASAQLLAELQGRQSATLAYYKRWLRMVLTAVGAGVVIATALLHILPDGLESLDDAGIQDAGRHPGRGPVFTVLANVHQRMINHESHSYTGHVPHPQGAQGGSDKRKRSKKTAGITPSSGVHHRLQSKVEGVGLLLLLAGFVATYITEAEVHALASSSSSETIKAHIMEAGIATHSLLVGVAFGMLSSLESAKGLAVALTVHQLCEGFAMGPVIYRGARTFLHAMMLVTVFAFSTPLGVFIGMALSWSSGGRVGQGTVFVQGVLSCVAAGLLLYVGLVEFLGGLLCTVHQDTWSHAAEGDADHTHQDPPSGLVLIPEGLKPRLQLGTLLPIECTRDPLPSYGGCSPSATEMSQIPPSTELHESGQNTACLSRGRFTQVLPAGATFPRVRTPLLIRTGSPLKGLDESRSLVGLSIASSPLMLPCSGEHCAHVSAFNSGTFHSVPSYDPACCAKECGEGSPLHEHLHHHSHSGHQQRHHHHPSSCGHVADFHCAHPHAARLGVTAMIVVGCTVMALLALIV